MTRDEVTYTGVHYNNINYSHQLYAENNTWSLSSFNVMSFSNYAWEIQSSDMLYARTVESSSGVRPVISLNSNALISDGNGSASNPYIIE